MACDGRKKCRVRRLSAYVVRETNPVAAIERQAGILADSRRAVNRAFGQAAGVDCVRIHAGVANCGLLDHG